MDSSRTSLTPDVEQQRNRPILQPDNDAQERIRLDNIDSFWPVYVEEAKAFDEAQVKNWDKGLDSLLIFVSDDGRNK